MRYGIILLAGSLPNFFFFFGYELVARLKPKSAIFGSWQKMYTSFLATIKFAGKEF